MPKPLSAVRRAVLEAVATGQVHHIHPFTWSIPLSLYDFRGNKRALESALKDRLIKVDATNKDYARPVHLTEKGAAALLAERPHLYVVSTQYPHGTEIHLVDAVGTERKAYADWWRSTAEDGDEDTDPENPAYPSDDELLSSRLESWQADEDVTAVHLSQVTA